MTVFVFDDKIIAPLKCGTRYLRSLGIPYRTICTTEDEWIKTSETEWEIMILRSPLEHLKSALHTEMINLLNGHTHWLGMSKESVLDRFISEDGSDHWCGKQYKLFYELWLNQNKLAKVINLKDLSYFMSMSNHHSQFIKEKYDFKNNTIWVSKDEVFEMIKNDFTSHYKHLIRLMEKDKEYYNKFTITSVKKTII